MSSKPYNKYVVREYKDIFLLCEGDTVLDEYKHYDQAVQRAVLLNTITVPGWKKRSVFIGADEDELATV